MHKEAGWKLVILCQNSKLKPNPSLKFLRHRKKKMIYNFSRTVILWRESINQSTLLSSKDLKLAGFVILLSSLYMKVVGAGRMGWKARGVKKIDEALTLLIPFIVWAGMPSPWTRELSNPAPSVKILLGTKWNIYACPYTV